MSLVPNGQTKLSANLLNSVAAGIIVTGAIAPIVAAILWPAGTVSGRPVGPGDREPRLDFHRNRATFLCQDAPEEAAPVSWFEVYAYFGMPLVVLGVGLLVYYVAVRDAEKAERDHRVPGE
jgi:hypothetical protein